MAECVSRSALLGHQPVAVIPNVLDTAVFRPHDRARCRAALGLPQDRPLVLFGAIQAGADPNKGFDLLVEALHHLVTDRSAAGIECVVFGAAHHRLAWYCPCPRIGSDVWTPRRSWRACLPPRT